MHLRDGLAEIPAGLSEVRRVAPPPTIAGVNADADASETRSSATDVRDISTTGFPMKAVLKLDDPTSSDDR